jgi:hypothetical protein
MPLKNPNKKPYNKITKRKQKEMEIPLGKEILKEKKS